MDITIRLNKDIVSQLLDLTGEDAEKKAITEALRDWVVREQGLQDAGRKPLRERKKRDPLQGWRLVTG